MVKLGQENSWVSYEEWKYLKEFYRQVDFILNPFVHKIKADVESYYYVNLKNSDDSIHTLGMKSRKTGKIYLTKEYEVDLSKPIEDTDFHFVRNSTSFDL